MIVSNLARYVVESDGGEGREINSSTFIGLGFIAVVLAGDLVHPPFPRLSRAGAGSATLGLSVLSVISSRR